jgi:hypothetical protein
VHVIQASRTPCSRATRCPFTTTPLDTASMACDYNILLASHWEEGSGMRGYIMILYRRLRFCKRPSLQMQEIARTKRT